LSTRIRVVIVDDEPLARPGIRARLAKPPDVEVVDEASSAESGIQSILRHRPDVAFLDVEMPDSDGFSVLQQLAAEDRPLAVFVTAHEDRAIEAFDVQAQDYLLKPIDDVRFARTVARLRALLTDRSSTPAQRVLIKDRGRIVALEPSVIDWIQSDGDYVRIFAGRSNYLHHATMTEFAALLPAQLFVRIHRAAVVNVERIASLTPITNGDYTVLLTTGARLKLTRTRREQLAERLGAHL